MSRPTALLLALAAVLALGVLATTPSHHHHHRRHHHRRAHPRRHHRRHRRRHHDRRRAAGGCHLRVVLPDPRCTPGAANPAVRPVNVDRTICRAGYSSAVRPSVSHTEPLKRRLIRRYHLTDRRVSDYELDHLIPLEAGGDPSSVRNLWPEPIASARRKDVVENRLHREICAHEVGLRAAQRQIARDWRHAG